MDQHGRDYNYNWGGKDNYRGRGSSYSGRSYSSRGGYRGGRSYDGYSKGGYDNYRGSNDNYRGSGRSSYRGGGNDSYRGNSRDTYSGGNRDSYRDDGYSSRGGYSKYRGRSSSSYYHSGGGRGDYNKDKHYSNGYSRGGRSGYHDYRDRGGRSSSRGRYSDRDNRSYDHQGGRSYQQYDKYHEKEQQQSEEGCSKVAELTGHTGPITVLQLDQNDNKLYSASQDGTVKIWDTSSLQCIATQPVGGRVDSMLVTPPFIFIGVTQQAGHPGAAAILIFNLASNAKQELTEHGAAVTSFLTVSNFLISGARDSAIIIWSLNQESQMFSQQRVLTAQQQGHSSAIQCLAQHEQYFFSGDYSGTYKVWDLASGSCLQTVAAAHESVIMDFLIWQGHVLTCSMDGFIKIWKLADNPMPGTIVEREPIFVYPEPESVADLPTAIPGVLKLCGCLNKEGVPVLVAAINVDFIQLWQLPTFEELGWMENMQEARGMTVGPQGPIVAGDKSGVIVVYNW